MLATFRGGLQVSRFLLPRKRLNRAASWHFPQSLLYLDSYWPTVPPFSLGKHFPHFRLDWHEPQTAFVLSHGNYRLLPWQNNNRCNKEHGTDELTALMHFYCPLPSISSWPSPPTHLPLLIWLVLMVFWLISRATPCLYCVHPKKRSIQSEAPSAERFSVFSRMYTSACSTPRR